MARQFHGERSDYRAGAGQFLFYLRSGGAYGQDRFYVPADERKQRGVRAALVQAAQYKPDVLPTAQRFKRHQRGIHIGSFGIVYEGNTADGPRLFYPVLDPAESRENLFYYGGLYPAV